MARACAHIALNHDLAGESAFDALQELKKLPLHRHQDVALNLSKVGALDASGVAVLARLHSALAARGGRLYVDQPRPQVAARLGALGLEPLLRTPSEPAAVPAIQPA